MTQSSRRLLLFAALSFAALLVAYWSHFDNGFEFDDAHVIVSNGYITDLRNIPSFFLDASTHTSLPSNQAHRPVITTLNAIDYWMAGGLDPFPFHLSIFVSFVLLGILLFFLYRRLLESTVPAPSSAYFALAGACLFCLHAANAETINYINARSDSFSTLCVVASLLLYQRETARRYHLYLLTLVVGIYAKQTAVMFVPLLFLWVLFFAPAAGARSDSLLDRRRWLHSLRACVPALLIAPALFLVNQLVLTPGAAISTNTTITRLVYLQTQLWVITQYVWNFFLPLDLSADPHYPWLNSLADSRVIVGLLVVLAMLAVAAVTARERRTRPVSYGILWFFIALAPTSSIVPLFQVANYHRVFFPYIGLVLAVVAAVAGLVERRRTALLRAPLARRALLVAFALVLGGHAYGVWLRSEVWGSSESLWFDAAQKSPDNGRALMNYGLSQMERGNYDEALRYYRRALEHWPTYPYLHVNLGILAQAMGDPGAAKKHFEDALRFGPDNPETHYYYARSLERGGEDDLAARHLERALALSPAHTKAKELLARVEAKRSDAAGDAIPRLEESVAREGTAETWVELSLAYYRAGRFEDCIQAARSALELRPAYAAAYNNICSAYNRLGQFERGIEACEKALEIAPDFARARANLTWAIEGRAGRHAED